MTWLGAWSGQWFGSWLPSLQLLPLVGPFQCDYTLSKGNWSYTVGAADVVTLSPEGAWLYAAAALGPRLEVPRSDWAYVARREVVELGLEGAPKYRVRPEAVAADARGPGSYGARPDGTVLTPDEAFAYTVR